jgi:hypothetical protein
MKPAESGEEKAMRQCWECLKRRLVCDHTLPHCKKCQKADKDCPGYDDQKPLQWVEPGKVTSRRRKKDTSCTIYTVPLRGGPKRGLQKPEESSTPPTSLSPDPIFDRAEHPWFWTSSTSSTEEAWDYLAEDHHQIVTWKNQFLDASSVGIIDIVSAIGGRAQLERIVRNGLQGEVAPMLARGDQSLPRLERILRVMQMFDVPDYGHLHNSTNEVVQAVHYCRSIRSHEMQLTDILVNVRVYPTMGASVELASNPAMVQFPLAALHILPPAVHHTLVCLSLNHFVHTLPIGTEKAVTATTRSKIYFHRGEAIRSLSQYVAKDKTRSTDLSISSILVFMAMEVSNFSTRYPSLKIDRDSYKFLQWRTGGRTPAA